MRCHATLPAGALALLLAAPAAALTPTPTALPSVQLRAAPDPAATGQPVTLTASRPIGGRQPRWTQIDGPPLSLRGADTLTATFVAPAVEHRTTVAFRFGLPEQVESQTIQVTIVPSDAVLVVLPTVTSPPGGLAAFAVSVDPLDHELATVGIDIGFAPDAPVAARPDGTPDCDAADGVAGTFELLPVGCNGAGCGQLRATLQFASPPSGAVIAYRCRVAVTGGEADSCTHALTCGDGQATTTEGDVLQIDCGDGAVVAMETPPAARFGFEVDPPVPHVGDPVRLVFPVAGIGGIPHYTLSGAAPLLDADNAEPDLSTPGLVAYELRAVQAGTSILRLGIDSEVRGGCPGHEFFYFTYDLSPPFPLTVDERGSVRVTGRVTALVGCQVAMSDVDVVLEPGHRVVRTDADGRFVFRGVTSGSYTIAVAQGCVASGCWPTSPVEVHDADVSLTLCPVRASCMGDCNDDGRVTIDELIAGIDLALAGDGTGRCSHLDRDANGVVQIDEVIAAVSMALVGCTP